MNAIYVDWMKEFSGEAWEFAGRRVLEETRGEWSDDNPEGISEDTGYPIYNYAYPLYKHRIDDEVILRVCEETNCTVVYHKDEGKYYLALTGCGMDYSQDIALADLIVDGCIDWDMLDDVYISGPLSVGKENYLKLLRELDRQTKIALGNLKQRRKEIKDKLREHSRGKRSKTRQTSEDAGRDGGQSPSSGLGS